MSKKLICDGRPVGMGFKPEYLCIEAAYNIKKVKGVNKYVVSTAVPCKDGRGYENFEIMNVSEFQLTLAEIGSFFLFGTVHLRRIQAWNEKSNQRKRAKEKAAQNKFAARQSKQEGLAGRHFAYVKAAVTAPGSVRSPLSVLSTHADHIGNLFRPSEKSALSKEAQPQAQ